MENRKLDEQIRIIKSLMVEQETTEGIASDIKNYLINKIQGAISNTALGDALDDIIGDVSNITNEKVQQLKKKFNIPDLSASELSKPELNKIYSSVDTDDEFYAKILWGLNLPVTTYNMNFLKLWRIAEMGIEVSSKKGEKTATNNPLNTTQPMGSDPKESKFNFAGVRNYSTPEIGIEATIKTLKLGRYKCIIDGLRAQLPYEQIAGCRTGKSKDAAMDIWGTGETHLRSVIEKYKNSQLKPRKIDFNPFDKSY
jgi:hypothetical protein